MHQNASESDLEAARVGIHFGRRPWKFCWGKPFYYYHQIKWVQWLGDPRYLLGALRWYEHRLRPGEWVIIPNPYAGYGKRSSGQIVHRRSLYGRKGWRLWRNNLKAVRRICCVQCQQVVPTDLLTKFYIRHPVWKMLQLQFGYDANPLLEFLWDEQVEARWQTLRPRLMVGYSNIKRLSADIGQVLKERAIDHLYRDLTPEQRRWYEENTGPEAWERYKQGLREQEAEENWMDQDDYLPTPQPGRALRGLGAGKSLQERIKSFLPAASSWRR